MSLNHKRFSIFYGWWVVVASFMISLITAGTIHLGFTAFFEPIANEFGWSYAQVSLASSLRGLEMGLLSPVVGLLVDRVGPRRLVFCGGILMGIGLVILSHVNNLAMFYGAFVLIAMGMSTCVGAVIMTAIAHWFRRRIGLAMGLAGAGVAIGGLVVPLITLLIDVYGWRMTILYIGVTVFVTISLFSLILRHKPEQYGYLPDGEAVSSEYSEQPVITKELTNTGPDMTIGQVLATRTFWHLGIAYCVSYMVVVAVLTHVMPYLSSISINRTTSSLLASAIPLLTIFGRLGLGWLGDRFPKKRLTGITMFMVSLGMLLFCYISTDSMWLAIPFVILFGTGYGGNATMFPVITGEYFGTRIFGSVLGFMMGVSAVGQILGPFLAGWVYDTWDSYQGIWFAYVGLSLSASFIIITTPSLTKSKKTADIH